jgi:hypothetical protein
MEFSEVHLREPATLFTQRRKTADSPTAIAKTLNPTSCGFA